MIVLVVPVSGTVVHQKVLVWSVVDEKKMSRGGVGTFSGSCQVAG